MTWVKLAGSISVVVALSVLAVAGIRKLPETEVVVLAPLQLEQSDTRAGSEFRVSPASSYQPQQQKINPRTLQTFRGAKPDGELRVLDGHLLINADVKRWIDSYLSATGEVYLTDIVEFMEAEMRTLPAPADAEALDLLTRYLAYREESGEYDELAARRTSQSGFDELSARTEWLGKLRQMHFSEKEIRAFFATDNSLNQYTLKKLKLVQEGGDTAQLELLDNELPLQLRVYREQANSLQRLRQIDNSTATPEQLWQQRAQEFGDDAAFRLQLLDEKRRDWEARLSGYRNFQLSLTGGAPDDQHSRADQLSAEDKEALLQAYRAEHFSAAELPRINAAIALQQKAR